MEPVQPSPTDDAHGLIPIECDNDADPRYRCAYCALMGIPRKRTRYICKANCCQMPLCSVGAQEGNVDCYSICHSNQELWKATKVKHEQMMKSYTKSNKKQTTALKNNKRKHTKRG